MIDSVVLWANHMETGANHNAQRIPWLLAGRAGGYFKTGQVIKGAGGQISRVRVMCEIANAMGAGVPYLGKPETGGPLPELRAAG